MAAAARIESYALSIIEEEGRDERRYEVPSVFHFSLSLSAVFRQKQKVFLCKAAAAAAIEAAAATEESRPKV